jgi:hypothetical protein
MTLVQHALRAAQASPPRPLQRLERALVVGGGGALGSALLGEALVAGRFQRVAAVVTAPLATSVRGFDPLPAAALQATRAAPASPSSSSSARGTATAATTPSCSRRLPTCCRSRARCMPPACAGCSSSCRTRRRCCRTP